MPMSFPLTKREIREEITSLGLDKVCQFDVAIKLRVRQVISDMHAYTDKKYETSTKNSTNSDTMVVRRIK